MNDCSVCFSGEAREGGEEPRVRGAPAEEEVRAGRAHDAARAAADAAATVNTMGQAKSWGLSGPCHSGVLRAWFLPTSVCTHGCTPHTSVQTPAAARCVNPTRAEFTRIVGVCGVQQY